MANKQSTGDPDERPAMKESISEGLFKPYRCPICGGTGKVQAGFYDQFGGAWSTTSISPEPCRSCNGTGIVWG
jgi:hypothetical protein